VLDAGAATGHGARALQRRYPKALVIALDPSLGMLKAAAGQRAWLRPFRRLCADASQLPLKDGSVDLIFSNFLLPWTDLDAAFAEFRRVLTPRGLLTFSSLGPDTLRELRNAWAVADSHTRVHPFIDMHDVGDALVRAGFAGPVLDVERYTLEYPEVRALAADLKAMGAHNAAADRPKGLTGRGKFSAMQAAYEVHRREGRLPATCEVVFGQAWTPIETRAHSDGGDSVSLEEMKRQLATRRPS
jgi:malonyl-CoA O-methyltransferase